MGKEPPEKTQEILDHLIKRYEAKQSLCELDLYAANESDIELQDCVEQIKSELPSGSSEAMTFLLDHLYRVKEGLKP